MQDSLRNPLGCSPDVGGGEMKDITHLLPIFLEKQYPPNVPIAVHLEDTYHSSILLRYWLIVTPYFFLNCSEAQLMLLKPLSKMISVTSWLLSRSILAI